ncbi:ester cyclase [Flavobacterium sp.]|uniref:ester cyclase n=1 Tax=Flavobacterium sp. TaxID=239 RepID=UPI00121997C9|nr:ester cyclase [Flavobacterium sp.]RZJ69143.1 MAG: hypothetical protein EOO49_18415 [Flavobacterium sp.]
MKTLKFFCLAFVGTLLFATTSCENAPKNDTSECGDLVIHAEKLSQNIKKYESVWDKIVNERKIDLINTDMFEKDVVLVTSPENIKGIEAFKAYYNNYLVGFSDVKFTIIDAYGQDDRIVKHWRFEGKHTGLFFGIPATGKSVDIEGVTLVKMKNGKIAQEQDFVDNLEFMNQLGIIPKQ